MVLRDALASCVHDTEVGLGLAGRSCLQAARPGAPGTFPRDCTGLPPSLDPQLCDTTRSAANTYARITSTSGISVAAVAPTQSASVDTSRSTPSRTYTSLWRL